MPFKSAQTFQKSRRHLKVPDTRYVSLRKLHAEDPPVSRHCCIKYSATGNLPPMIRALLLLLKPI
jgi:hypothetical protein